MNTLAVQGIGFGSGSTYRNNMDKSATHKSQNNEPTVTIPRSKYEELRRAAAKGVMAVTMATAVLAGGGAVTSCSKSDDVPEVNTQTNKIDVQGQAILMNMLQTVGVPITTNETNPKYVKTFSVSDITTDYPVVSNCDDLKGNWTYNDQLSTKDKSIYNSTDDKQLVVTKENNNPDYQLKGVITQSGEDPITIEIGKNTFGDKQGLQTIKNNDCMAVITRSSKGTGWVFCEGADITGDVQVRAMAK
jgi:hypothetical protein